MDWTGQDKLWIAKIDDLFADLFGPDFCEYEYTKTKNCILVPGQFPAVVYKHNEWEKKLIDQATQSNLEVSSPGEINNAPSPSHAKLEEQQHACTCQKIIPSSTADSDNSVAHSGCQWKLDNITKLTRGQRAALPIPKVASISPQEVVLDQHQSTETNPSQVQSRPPESIVLHALKLLREGANSTSDDKGSVVIGSLGTFSKESVRVFETMCTLAVEAENVRKEKAWLSITKNNDPDVTMIKAVLWNSRPREEVLTMGACMMDVSDFSTLACEHYVNGFTIDTICLKFLKESRSSKVVYLPTYSQTWARQGSNYFSHKVKKYFSHCAVQQAKCILSPVHFDSPQHWGLVCFDTEIKTIYFDDGLKISPPRDTLPVVKKMLGGFEALANSTAFQEENWNLPTPFRPLPRINMHQQTKSGEGSGSCGVGVILAVRDIIQNETCLAPFTWKFENMAQLRKELMNLVLCWKNRGQYMYYYKYFIF